MKKRKVISEFKVRFSSNWSFPLTEWSKINTENVLFHKTVSGTWSSLAQLQKMRETWYWKLTGCEITLACFAERLNRASVKRYLFFFRFQVIRLTARKRTFNLFLIFSTTNNAMQLVRYRGELTGLLTSTGGGQPNTAVPTKQFFKSYATTKQPFKSYATKMDLCGVYTVYEQANIPIFQWRHQCACVWHFPCSFRCLLNFISLMSLK